MKLLYFSFGFMIQNLAAFKGQKCEFGQFGQLAKSFY
jgi:hypothetical protein